MSKAREIMKNNKAKTGIIPYMGNWAKKFFSRVANQGHSWGTWIKREIAVEELETIRINMGITEGMSPSQLAQEHGLTSAIDPKVLI